MQIWQKSFGIKETNGFYVRYWRNYISNYVAKYKSVCFLFYKKDEELKDLIG